MNQNDLFQATKFLIQSLDTLKNEYERLLHSTKSLSSDNIEDNLDLLKKSMDMIDLGIDEIQAMMELDRHLQDLESEKHRLCIQVKRLTQENAWLRDELGSTQKKLHESEQMNASYLVDMENLRFLVELKQYDANMDMNAKDDNQSDHEQDLMNDLFPPEEYDNEQTNSLDTCSDQSILSAPSPHSTFTSTNYYEIPIRLKSLHNLVIQYTSQGRHELAIPLCRHALDDLKKKLGHQHPDVATMLNILALVYRDQMKFKEATALLYDALAIREKTLGLDHPTVAATLNNIAVLYSKRNKFKQAEPLCKRALDIREKCLGQWHPDIAKQLNNLAVICLNQEKYDEVESYYQRAIDIYVKNFECNDSNVINTKFNLASIYLKQEKYSNAEQSYRDILMCAYEKHVHSLRTTANCNGIKTNWNDTCQIDESIVTATLKYLCTIYRQQQRYDIAESIEKIMIHSRTDSRTIIQILNIIKQVNHRNTE